jgi:hypothetical protein
VIALSKRSISSSSLSELFQALQKAVVPLKFDREEELELFVHSETLICLVTNWMSLKSNFVEPRTLSVVHVFAQGNEIRRSLHRIIDPHYLVLDLLPPGSTASVEQDP